MDRPGSDPKVHFDAQPDGQGQPNEKQWKTMVQKLLADRFKITFHYDNKELSAYALVVGKTGPKLTKSQGDPNGRPATVFHRAWGFSCEQRDHGEFRLGLLQASRSWTGP